jgi:hypothetical protein
MVYKTKFLKQVIENDYTQVADGAHTWELTDQPLAAIWITIKGNLVAINQCIDDFMLSLTGLDIWFGGFNITHYTTGIKALIMNLKLKQHWPYLLNSTQTVGEVTGVTFPVLFGAPYLNEAMALPGSLSNRKRLTLTLDVATAALTGLEIDIAEVILPGAAPVGCIKQEEMGITHSSEGDHDLWLQTNWDLLKLLIYSNHVPTATTYVSTIEHAGLEIDDFAFGYKSVPWEILHGELMDELEGSGPVEDHTHSDPGQPGAIGMPSGLEHWIANYGQLDFFYNKDLKWRAPLSGASSAKLKYHIGVGMSADDWAIVTACYVPNGKL